MLWEGTHPSVTRNQENNTNRERVALCLFDHNIIEQWWESTWVSTSWCLSASEEKQGFCLMCLFHVKESKCAPAHLSVPYVGSILFFVFFNLETLNFNSRRPQLILLPVSKLFSFDIYSNLSHMNMVCVCVYWEVHTCTRQYTCKG